MIDLFPEWLQIFILSMIPGIESRYVVPFAIYRFGWGWWQVFPIAITGNIILVPFGLLFLRSIEQYLKQYPSWKKTIDLIFPKIRKRADKKIQRYENLALLFFVIVPLPFTGAGLGTLIAYLFDLKFYSSILLIFIGVIISTSITTFVFITGRYLFF